MTVAIPKSIALIDFSHMLTVNFKAMASDAGPNDAGNVTLKQLAAIRSATEHCVVCLDSPPYWRKKLYPEYKGKRSEREPEFGPIQKWTLERVELDGYNIARAPECEADDVIATLACQYSQQYGCTDVRIVGADKDALQCVSDSVQVFVPKGRDEFEIRGPDWLLKEYAVKPSDFALLLAIMGDTSDNIPGIKGLGKGHGAKLIELYKNPAGMAVGLTAAVSDAKLNDKKLSAVWERYAAGMAQLPLYWKLTTLDSNCLLDKHPLKYLEKLPVQKLVEEDYGPDEQLDAIDAAMAIADDPDWDAVEAEADAKMREEMAKALPVDKPWIAPDPPPAPEQLKPRMPEERERDVARQNTKAPQTEERIDAMQQQIRMGNDMERARLEKATLDRHGVERPKMPSVGDVAWGTAPQDPMKLVPPEAQADIRKLGEQLGKEGLQATAQSLVDAARSQISASSAAPSSSPNGAGNAASQVVPQTRGPRKAEALEEPAMAAIVPYAAPSWMLSTQPASAGQAFSIAVKLHNSRRWMGRHDNPEQIAAVILRGRELGIGMMTALDAFHVIKQRVCASSQLISALAENDPNHDYTMLVELDEDHAVVEIKHKKQPKPVQWSYTIAEAEVLGLLLPSPKTGEPSQWVKRPKTMLAKTAKANGHRFMFPSACLGLHSLETETDGQEHIGNDD